MEYTSTFILIIKKLVDINYVRRYKGLLLPIELVGERGGKMTDCYRNEEERSALIWKDRQELNQTLMKKKFRR